MAASPCCPQAFCPSSALGAPQYYCCGSLCPFQSTLSTEARVLQCHSPDSNWSVDFIALRTQCRVCPFTWASPCPGSLASPCNPYLAQSLLAPLDIRPTKALPYSEPTVYHRPWNALPLLLTWLTLVSVPMPPRETCHDALSNMGFSFQPCLPLLWSPLLPPWD